MKAATAQKSKREPVRLVSPNPNPKPSDGKYIGGSRWDNLNNEIATQVVNAIRTDPTDEKDTLLKRSACLEAMAGIGPQDEIEGMLAAQMVAAYHAAMECYRLAMVAGLSIEGRQHNLSFANKLTRTYAMAMEALDKHRGKGQQTVRVEHVHVYEGGRAIVGNVQTGVGVQQKSEEQPDANAITDSHEPEMRSAFETVGEALPQRCDEKR